MFSNMSQRPVEAFHPGVLARLALLMEHAFERAGVDIPDCKAAKNLICRGHRATKDGSALVA